MYAFPTPCQALLGSKNWSGIQILSVAFDFWFGHDSCNVFQPWLLSNIIDEETGTVPVPLKEFEVLERAGVRIGLIGLVEKYEFSVENPVTEI